MNGSAPNTSRTGSHFVPVMKPKPNLWRLSIEARVICSAIAARVMIAPAANSPVITRNSRSPKLTSPPNHCGRSALRVSITPSIGCAPAGSMDVARSDARQQQLAACLECLELGLHLAHDFRRKRRVVERRGELLAVVN